MIDTLPGSHTIGLEILGHNPPVILSEAQATLAPGTNTPATMTLLGALSTSYVECASGPVDATNCQSSFTATPANGPGTGYYTLTAIGSDFEGFPIALQGTSTAPIGFDNGSFSVMETDGNGILSLGASGPYSNSGSALTGPSGGFYVATQATYGRPFTASCIKTGTATVGLVTTATDPTVPLSGETYTIFDPANNFATSGNYPGAGTLADGSKTPGNPAYHGGSNPNAVTTLTSINCDANLVLTVN
jgi:hypothetical protein